MNKKVTIYDIAERLNISAATVSRALNNNQRVSSSTRELVSKVAFEMNYEPNGLASALRRGKSKTVGVIVPRVNSYFFGNIIRGIEDELYPLGYKVIISQTHENEERQIENIQALLNAQIDGVFLSITKQTRDLSIFKRVLEQEIPLVFFDRKVDIEGVSTVTLDDYRGGYMATEHLIKQGCSKIAHLTGDLNLNIYKDRFEGYKQALIDNNLIYNKDFYVDTANNIQGGRNAVNKLLNLKEKPDAFTSTSDLVSLGIIQELKERKYKIPEDFCVVGFSNEPFTKFMELSISSIEQNPIEMGEHVAKVFLEQIRQKSKKNIKRKLILSPELIVRKSSNKS